MVGRVVVFTVIVNFVFIYMECSPLNFIHSEFNMAYNGILRLGAADLPTIPGNVIDSVLSKNLLLFMSTAMATLVAC